MYLATDYQKPEARVMRTHTPNVLLLFGGPTLGVTARFFLSQSKVSGVKDSGLQVGGTFFFSGLGPVQCSRS